MLISIVTIFLNAEKFLKETVESVFAQTDDEWELLLVDDGSSDASSAIARAYAEQYPDRIRYLEHPGHENRGMSAARNLGARHARGDVIAFLDSDDVWVPTKLEHQKRLLEAHPDAGMIYGASQYWYSWSGDPADVARDHVPALGVETGRVLAPPHVAIGFVRRTVPVPPPTAAVIRRSVYERIGGFEECFPGLYDDQVFYVKLCLDTPVLVSAECCTRYRRHPDSFVAVVDRHGQRRAARLVFLRWLAKYLEARPEIDGEMRRAVADELRLLAPSLSRRVARRLVPERARRWVGARFPEGRWCPPRGWVRFGSLRRLTPISRRWGFDRGTAIDRYYIERFLATHAADIVGLVLEVGDDRYARALGGERVTRADVLDVRADNPKATLVADLAATDAPLPADAFDCIVATQVLHLTWDVHAAIANLHRMLRPGGVALVTLPAISQVTDWDGPWYWRFSRHAAERLFAERFPTTHLTVTTHGNVLAATAFLQGLAAEELTPRELGQRDPAYEVLVTVRAQKPSA